MREMRTSVVAKAEANPLRAGHRARSAEPRGEVNHHEDLIKNRPKPRDPDAFKAVHEQPRDHHHRAAYVEHPGSIRQAQRVPRHRVTAKKIISQASRRSPRNPKTREER